MFGFEITFYSKFLLKSLPKRRTPIFFQTFRGRWFKLRRVLGRPKYFENLTLTERLRRSTSF